jgi:spore coat polysaccharide biosynthesis predicted glycosyltransferase SpsG
VKRPLRLVARLTASAEVGLGHFVRCRALAEQNLARGGSNLLVAEAMDPWLETWAAGVFTRDVVGPDEGAGLTRERWREIVARHAADVVVFDHYGVSEETHRGVEALGAATLAIDDLPGRALGAAVVLNQNVGVREDEYRGLVPASTRLLVGPRYALVSHDVRRARVRRAGDALRILVSFGGGRHGALIDDVLSAVATLRPDSDVPRLAVTVVASDVDASRWPSAGPHTVRIVAPTPGLAAAFADADVAVGAPGSTSYERLALGLPSILVQLSDNQAPVARGLIDAGAALVLGERERVTREDWVDALRRVCGDATVRRDMASAGRRLVDGRGTERVLEVMDAAVARRSAA